MISAFLVTNQTNTLTRREIIECLFSIGDKYVVFLYMYMCVDSL